MAVGSGDDDAHEADTERDETSRQEPRAPTLNGHHGVGLADLQKKIADERAALAARSAPPAGQPTPARGMGVGFRMATDFTSAIAVGGLVGWGFDQWLNTTPWAFIICFLLGFCAAILNVVRLAQSQQNSQRGSEIAKSTVAQSTAPGGEGSS